MPAHSDKALQLSVKMHLINYMLRLVDPMGEMLDFDAMLYPAKHQKLWRNILSLVLHFDTFKRLFGAKLHKEKVEVVIQEM